MRARGRSVVFLLVSCLLQVFFFLSNTVEPYFVLSAHITSPSVCASAYVRIGTVGGSLCDFSVRFQPGNLHDEIWVPSSVEYYLLFEVGLNLIFKALSIDRLYIRVLVSGHFSIALIAILFYLSGRNSTSRYMTILVDLTSFVVSLLMVHPVLKRKCLISVDLHCTRYHHSEATFHVPSYSTLSEGLQTSVSGISSTFPISFFASFYTFLHPSLIMK